ncbi:MAG: hypothetical protein V4633_17475 [Pseudomonadota bacterium]
MIPPLFRTLLLAAMVSALAACSGGSDAPPPPPATVDTDADGVRDPLDVAPGDPLCAAASDAAGGVCHARTLAASPLTVIGHGGGKIYFSSEETTVRLYAYDLATRHFIARTTITGYTPRAYAYSPDHGRIYVGDTNGKIHSFSETLQESPAPFADMQMRIDALVAAGTYLVPVNRTGDIEQRWTISREGVQADRRVYTSPSSHFNWNAATSALYYYRDYGNPNDLFFQTIDQSTGKFSAPGETPYDGAYAFGGPIRSSVDGKRVMIGSGAIFGAPGLAWQGSLGTSFTDATWIANDDVLTMEPLQGRTWLQRFNGDRVRQEEVYVVGDVLAVAVVGSANHLVVKRAGHIEFLNYVPSNDSDGDGVPNAKDKFPADKSAAVDSDNDGYPDDFLGTYTAADSNSGLSKDFFPRDAACHAAPQGSDTPGSMPANCNYATAIPAYDPDAVTADEQGIIYLLSKVNARIYRWSAVLGAHLPPLVVGQKNEVTTRQPNVMRYWAHEARLYLGYQSGLVSYIALAGDSRETSFTVTSGAVTGLAAVGNYLLVQGPIGDKYTHTIYDSAGRRTDGQGNYHYSNSWEWGAAQGRVYFFRADAATNDLLFETIDQLTGKITGSGGTPYNGAHAILGPIRAAAGGARIVLGTGNIYEGNGLTLVKSLGEPLKDAQWRADGALVTIPASGSDTRVSLYDAQFALLGQRTVAGTPLALLASGERITIVTQVAGKPVMTAF